jgi:hypothetical protein
VRPEIAVHWCAEGGLPAVSGSWASSGIGIPTCPVTSTRSSVRSRAPRCRAGPTHANQGGEQPPSGPAPRAQLAPPPGGRRRRHQRLLKGNESGGHSWLRSGRPRSCRRPVVGCLVKAPPAGEGGHHPAGGFLGRLVRTAWSAARTWPAGCSATSVAATVVADGLDLMGVMGGQRPAHGHTEPVDKVDGACSSPWASVRAVKPERSANRNVCTVRSGLRAITHEPYVQTTWPPNNDCRWSAPAHVRIKVDGRMMQLAFGSG